jgi:hypothetical protein
MACERASSVQNADPTPQPVVPGPRRIEPVLVDAPLPTTIDSTSAFEEMLEVLAGRGSIDAVRLQRNPLTPGWDIKRVTLVEFKQTGDAITVIGEAPDDSDIAQLSKRLASDPRFANVTPMSGERRGDHWRFEIQLKAPGADPRTALVVRP